MLASVIVVVVGGENAAAADDDDDDDDEDEEDGIDGLLSADVPVDRRRRASLDSMPVLKTLNVCPIDVLLFICIDVAGEQFTDLVDPPSAALP